MLNQEKGKITTFARWDLLTSYNRCMEMYYHISRGMCDIVRDFVKCVRHFSEITTCEQNESDLKSGITSRYCYSKTTKRNLKLEIVY